MTYQEGQKHALVISEIAAFIFHNDDSGKDENGANPLNRSEPLRKEKERNDEGYQRAKSAKDCQFRCLDHFDGPEKQYGPRRV